MRSRCSLHRLACWVLFLTLVPLGATPADSPFTRENARAVSTGALGSQLPEVTLVDSSGQRVSLATLRGKPLILSMIFTSCHHICPTTTRNLNAVVRVARDALGEDSFNVVTVGFDTVRDTPPMMEKFRQDQGVSDPNWYFLAGDRGAIDTLSEASGFIFAPAGGGFDHLIQTTLYDAEGSVVQQVYGMKFDAPYLVEPLKRLVFQTSADDSLVSNLAKQVRLFCTVYDPASDHYRFDYSLYVGIAIGFLCVGLVGVFLVQEWRKTLRHRKHQS